MFEIGEKLKKIIKHIFDVDVDVQISEAPKNFDADYSTNVAMLLAKKIQKSPREIAEKIIENYNDKAFEISIAGPGFLNFKSSDEYFKEKIADFSNNFSKNISQNEYKDKTVICEFSDPNPFKVLHIGHLYTSIVGDSISKLVEFAGGKVIRANFGGDVGLHVAKNLYASNLHLAEFQSNMSPEEIVSLLGKFYVEGTNDYENDDVAHAKITELNKRIFIIATNGEPSEIKFPDFLNNTSEDLSSDKNLADFYWWTRKNCYQYFANFYNSIGLKFDKDYPESTVAYRGLKEVKAHIGTVYQESDGAIVFKGEDYDKSLHTRVFINKNGLPTYETKDIGLLFTKYDDYHFDKSIVITGNDIIDYMKVVLTSVKQYAPELVEKTIHLTHGNVTLPGHEKMSSRKGNFVKAIDVINDTTTEMASSLKERNENTEVDSKVVMSAIKYSFLKYKVGTNFDFDAKESVKMTGNSGPYLQSSAVR